MMNPDPNPVVLSAVVPEGDLPRPGSWIKVEMSNAKKMDLVAVVHNVRGVRDQAFRTPKSLTYVPVVTDTEHSEVTHAGIARRVNRRIRLEWYTLCDRNGQRVARARVGGTLDGSVTCKQCRTQLVEDGMLDSIEPPSA